MPPIEDCTADKNGKVKETAADTIAAWTPPGWVYNVFPLPSPDAEVVTLDWIIAAMHREIDICTEWNSTPLGRVLHVAHLLVCFQEADGLWPATFNLRTGEAVGTERSGAPLSLFGRLNDILESTEFDGLSLTAQELDEKYRQVFGLEDFARVIVVVDQSGAVVVHKQDGYLRRILVFDQTMQEGDFNLDFPGLVLGYSTCLMAALATAWVEHGNNLHWSRAVRNGICMSRTLHWYGYRVEEDELRRLTSPSHSLDKNWSILRCKLPQSEEIYKMATRVVRDGPEKALKEVPIEKIGFWQSIDRREIEGVRSVSNAMHEYKHNWSRQKRPLSIAVFGPPGSGKSTVVKQIAEKIGIKKPSILEFNLSQYERPDQLARAFHQIRDKNLEGATPLVFWDEFDSAMAGSLGWLRYFLVPMQDDKFFDEGVLHPIGPAIFVFAGGTCFSYKEFTQPQSHDRDTKKPDFVSRLRAFIDVRGLGNAKTEAQDGLFMIRRALLLRTFLQSPEINARDIKRSNGEIRVDEGVLRAFLRTREYTHGARSLEQIVQLCSFAGKSKFELSSLPPEHLLQMHVDAKNFLRCASGGK